MQRSALSVLPLALLLAVIPAPAGAQQNGMGRPPEASAQAPAMSSRGPAGRSADGPGSRPAPAVLMGTLVDETSGRPLPTASIEIRSEQDSSLAAGALTDAEGRYRIEGLAPGRCFVRASTLGYAPSELPAVTLSPGAVVRLEIALEARVSGNDDVSEARYGDATLASLRELTRNETGNRDASLQLDVTRTLLGIKVETGARAEERVIDTDLSRVPFGASEPVSGGNAFDYDARIWAGYAQASRALGRLSLQGGLRLELADTRFDLRSTGEAYDNRHTSLYPSASALLDLGEGQSVRAGYSRRVQRPRTGQLNPFPLQEDSLSLLVGNPSLLPRASPPPPSGTSTGAPSSGWT